MCQGPLAIKTPPEMNNADNDTGAAAVYDNSGNVYAPDASPALERELSAPTRIPRVAVTPARTEGRPHGGLQALLGDRRGFVETVG